MVLQVNESILSGYLANDPEVRYTQSGKAVASFTLAVNKRIKNPRENQKTADFIPIVVWEKLAEICGEQSEPQNIHKEKNNKDNSSHIQKSFNNFWIAINVTFLLIGLFPLVNNGDMSARFIPLMIGLNIILTMMKVIFVFLYGNDFEPEEKDESNSIQNSTSVIEPQPKYQIGDYVRIMFINHGCYNESYYLQYFDKYIPDRVIHFKCDLKPEKGSVGKVLTFYKDDYYNDDDYNNYLYFIELNADWVILMNERNIRRINKETYFNLLNVNNKSNLRKNTSKDNSVVHHTTIIKREDNSFSDFMTGAAIGAAVNDFESRMGQIDTNLGSDSFTDNNFLDD
jgi:single stranded DNA-binding protein (ssb)